MNEETGFFKKSVYSWINFPEKKNFLFGKISNCPSDTN